jgi:hypothetical protein
MLSYFRNTGIISDVRRDATVQHSSSDFNCIICWNRGSRCILNLLIKSRLINVYLLLTEYAIEYTPFIRHFVTSACWRKGLVFEMIFLLLTCLCPRHRLLPDIKTQFLVIFMTILALSSPGDLWTNPCTPLWNVLPAMEAYTLNCWLPIYRSRSRYFPPFMEPKRSLPFSQKPSNALWEIRSSVIQHCRFQCFFCYMDLNSYNLLIFIRDLWDILWGISFVSY